MMHTKKDTTQDNAKDVGKNKKTKMKTLNETFTDKEFLRLKKAKKKLNHKHRSWHDFLLYIITKKFLREF